MSDQWWGMVPLGDNTAHVVPKDDLILHVPNEDCSCGPEMIPLSKADGSMGWVIRHHSLDGRERNE